LWSICPGWTWTMILAISVSQIARIIGPNHCCLALFTFRKQKTKNTWPLEHFKLHMWLEFCI
jgi:hypothetical protein